MCNDAIMEKDCSAASGGSRNCFVCYSGSGNLFIAANLNELWRVRSSSVAQLQHLTNMNVG